MNIALANHPLAQAEFGWNWRFGVQEGSRVSLWLFSFAIFGLLVMACDLGFRRVPNKLLVAVVVLQAVWLTFCTLHMPKVLRPDAGSWSQAGLGFVLGLLIFYPLWHFRKMGAGDVKFIAVLGFLLGPSAWLPVLLGTVICGIYALGAVVLSGYCARLGWWFYEPSRRGAPYAACIALAALAWVGFLNDRIIGLDAIWH